MAKKTVGKSDKREVNWLLAAAGMLIVVLVVVAYVMAKGKSSSGNGDSDFLPFAPIWIAVFVPSFIAMREKKGRELNRKKALLVATLGFGVAVLVVLAIRVMVK